MWHKDQENPPGSPARKLDDAVLFTQLLVFFSPAFCIWSFWPNLA